MDSSNQDSVGEKLQKVLARSGVGSRREMEKHIAAGRVKVNGVVATLGDRVTLDDKVVVDGHTIHIKPTDKDIIRVILYNKPEGEICSQNDPQGRPTVFQNLPKLSSGRWISIGRLDFNTSGLLLFTNDGDLAHKLMHPSSNIDREYLVRVQGDVTDEKLQALKNGVMLDDGEAKFTDVVPGSQEGSNRWFYCVVMEGKNREVRRLWESQQCRVSRLKRVRYGSIFIPSHVRVGQWIELEEKELKDLYETVGLTAPKQKFSAELKSFRDRQNKRLLSPGSKAAKTKRTEKTRPGARRETTDESWRPPNAERDDKHPKGKAKVAAKAKGRGRSLREDSSYNVPKKPRGKFSKPSTQSSARSTSRPPSKKR